MLRTNLNDNFDENIEDFFNFQRYYCNDRRF